MSDDIDRLKTVLENLLQTRDTLQDHHDAMSDVVNAVRPVELETDAEGHGALRDISNAIRIAYAELHQVLQNVDSLVWKLRVKARVTR
jgi:hypothetical protein